MEDEEDEGEDEEQMDQSTGDMNDESQHPQGDEKETDNGEHNCVWFPLLRDGDTGRV